MEKIKFIIEGYELIQTGISFDKEIGFIPDKFADSDVVIILIRKIDG